MAAYFSSSLLCRWLGNISNNKLCSATPSDSLFFITTDTTQSIKMIYTDKHPVSVASRKKGSHLETPLHTDGATTSAVEICALLGHYAACSGTDSLSYCQELTLHVTLQTTEHSSHLLRGESLKPQLSTAESLLGSRRQSAV